MNNHPERGPSVRRENPAAPTALASTKSSANPTYEGTALLIDDEEPVRLVASRMLEICGFKVVAASDGQEGVDFFDEHAATVKVVLLDLTMPKLSGEHVFQHVRQRNPELAVILMSGYARIEAEPLLAQGKRTGFLQKPYTFAQLRQQLQQLLGA